MYVTESFSGTDAPDPHAPASIGMDGRTATKKPTTLKGTYPLSGWNAARSTSAARTNTYPFIGKDQRDWNDTSMYATQGNSVARNGSELPVGIDMFTAAHDARRRLRTQGRDDRRPTPERADRGRGRHRAG